MNSFQCNFANATSTKKLGTPQVARRYVAAVTVFVFTTFIYREPTVVAQKRRIITPGIIRIARRVHSNHFTGFRRSATTFSRARMTLRFTKTCTTSEMARNSISLRTTVTRLTTARRVFCLHLHLCQPTGGTLIPPQPRLRHRRDSTLANGPRGITPLVTTSKARLHAVPGALTVAVPAFETTIPKREQL
jgi:hypothetical protein